MVTPINLLDYIFIALLALSCALGMWRGFIQEAMSLAGWFIALSASYALADYLAAHLLMTGFGDSTRYGLAFILIFIASLFIWGMMTALTKKTIGAIGLGPIDRALGGIFGAVRGTLVLSSLILFISLTPIDRAEAWQASSGVTIAKTMVNTIKPYLPSTIAAFIS